MEHLVQREHARCIGGIAEASDPGGGGESQNNWRGGQRGQRQWPGEQGPRFIETRGPM